MTDKDNHRFSDDALSGPTIDRRTTVKLLGAAGLTGLAGCAGNQDDSGGTTTDDSTTGGGSETETSASTSEKQGGRLTAGWFTNSIDKLDPTRITLGQYFQMAANIFNGLVMLEKDFTIQGDLAKDWTVENDGKTITFQLREGVKFHNGQDFTAEDVKYSIRRTIEKETVNASKLSSLKSLDNGGVETPDDYTVRLNFEQPMAPALVYLTRGPGRAAAVVSKSAIDEMGEDKYLTQPIGTGPFEVAKHNVGNELVLDANENYFKTDDQGNQLPYLDGIDVKMIPEPSTMVSALQSGDVQFTNEIPPSNIKQLEGAGSVNVQHTPGPNWFGMIMNQEREPFDSTKARQGIAKLIDNEAYVRTAHFGKAKPDTGPINPATGWVWRDDKPDHQDYAPEEGKRLLKEAGYANASFKIMASPNYLRDIKVIRQQLQQAGLDVEIDQVPNATYWERMADMDYDMAMDGSVGDPDPDQSLYNFYRQKDQGGSWNYMSYTDETSKNASRVNELLGKQRETMDRNERKKVLQEAEDLLIEDVPHAYLVHQWDVLGMRSSVNGFVHIPYMRYFDTVWLDQ
jgi:peptide/nickel transport system substrate-binding protein